MMQFYPKMELEKYCILYDEILEWPFKYSFVEGIECKPMSIHISMRPSVSYV